MNEPTCDWFDVKQGKRCSRRATFQWGHRYICANHATSWLRAGKTMKRMPYVEHSPYPGNQEGLWERTA